MPLGWLHFAASAVALTVGLVTASLYILIGGGVNEVFLRVDALHSLVPNFSSPLKNWQNRAWFSLVKYFGLGAGLRRYTPIGSPIGGITLRST